MTLNRQKIHRFDPSKTITNLSNSMILPNKTDHLSNSNN